MRREIERLRTKGLALQSRDKLPAYADDEEEEERDEWMDFDQYMHEFGDYYAEEAAKQRREIRIPPISYASSLFNILIHLLFTFDYSQGAEKSEQFVRSILQDMLDSLDTQIPEKTAEEVVQQVLDRVARHSTVSEIVEDLLDLLPCREPSDLQQSIIETTAERLFCLEEPEVI